MSELEEPMWQRWARFRFSVIGELLACPPEKGQLQKAIKRLAKNNYQHPIDADRRIALGASTIERWYYKAKAAADPISALGRKIRGDAGIRWSMSELVLAELKAQYRGTPPVERPASLRQLKSAGRRAAPAQTAALLQDRATVHARKRMAAQPTTATAKRRTAARGPPP